MNARQGSTAARLLAAAGASALLAGCASNPFDAAKVDPTSPVAGEVSRLVRANRDYPTFAEIPKKPTDVRPLRLFGQAADEVAAAGAALEQATAPSTWTLSNTDSFAARARSDAGPDAGPADPRSTEAFADDLRRRATPPPPPKR
ncbi:hypothetical protein [Phenylobacterium sp.]|uniref:hypothetical protein n=1 Tax=Phenylobacterium sp. TaxID=1871053 RepID=UPI002BDA532B|nr:hypothetical protein [Phenylobacterium sp.]HVI32925.1 hypothetical protein [Phenylobacterium sp.]